MKVTLFFTIAGMGGMQMNGRGLARSLLRAGHEVQVLSSVLNVASAGEVKPGENDDLLAMGAKIVYLPVQSGAVQRGREFLRLRKVVREFGPDVMIGTGTSWHLGLLGAALPGKVRTIFYEGMSGESNGKKDPRWLVRWFFDEVVGQSPRVLRTFCGSFGWRKKTGVIPAYPEPLELTAVLPQVRPHVVPLGTARAAFFSRLVEGKQAFWLVRQWDRLKSVIGTLDIHGRGPEQPLIEAYILEHGLQDRVRCCGGYPSGQAYADLLAGYDVTLLPTIFPEGAPLVLLESMACGVPFVANGMGGIPDYATGNPDCIVVPQQTAFLDGVEQMTGALANDGIDQERLQRFYLTAYSQAAIERQWLNYLTG
jgi:glycosyltransferase involved in cell wall biosynthesis